MILRPARLVLIGLLIVMAWPGSIASTGEAVTVDEKIDLITEPPEYDWLRGASGPETEEIKGEIKKRGKAGKSPAKPGKSSLIRRF